MKTKLIQALRSAASKLRGGCEYNWMHMESCNCGVLAAEIIGRKIKEGDLSDGFSRIYGIWNELAKSAIACPVTGIPINHVFAALKAAGLTLEDIAQTEHLKNPAVLSRMKADEYHGQYKEREFVARYFDTWADMLTEELTSTQDQVPAIESKDVRFHPAQILKRMETQTTGA